MISAPAPSPPTRYLSREIVGGEQIVTWLKQPIDFGLFPEQRQRELKQQQQQQVVEDKPKKVSSERGGVCNSITTLSDQLGSRRGAWKKR